MKDFADEVPGYLGNARMALALNDERRKLADKKLPIPETAFELWRRCCDEKFVPQKELRIMEAWMEKVLPTLKRTAE